MSTWNIGDRLHGFRVGREDILPHLDAKYRKLTHEKTGATLYCSDRDDGQLVFGVGFRTLPEDDTGVFHVIEHSVLDGSESFRLKEPFVNLIKTSLFVDLNAATYNDKTLYYFISTNEQAFMNMMTVYLDAVFHPLMLSDRRIFEKEAWHLEPDEQGGVRCSGVVFNEMQGRDNQPDALMHTQVGRQLFPDLYWRFVSGGDPAAIRTLSYEKLCETYGRTYRADNAVFYLSGRSDFERELSAVDRVLSELADPVGEPPAPAPLQAPVISPDGMFCFQQSDSDPIEGNTHLKFSCVLGNGSRPEEATAFSILCRYLAETTESPLSRSVLNAGIGRDFSMELDSDYRQPVVMFDLRKSDPERAERFREVVLSTLEALVSSGLNRERLNNLINDYEVYCRRLSMSVNIGYDIMESLIRTHVQQGDADVPDGLVIRERLAENPKYFEDLIERYILNSNHWALTRCVPSRTAAEEKRAAMDGWLAEEARRLHESDGAYDELKAHVGELNAYLLAPDDPAAVAAVPRLSSSDILLPPVERDVETGTVSSAGQSLQSVRYIEDTGEIAVAGFLFDMTSLSGEEIFFARCLADALTSLPTEHHGVEQMTDRALELNAILTADFFRGAGGIDPADTNAYLRISVNVPEEKLEAAAGYVYEYLTEAVFDREILRQLFSNSSDMRSRMIGGGNGTAFRLAEASLSGIGAAVNAWSGPDVYRRLTALADDFDGCADGFIAGLLSVRDRLFLRQRPLSFFIGCASAYAAWEHAVSGLRFGTENPERKPIPMAERQSRALTIPGEVNYCAEVYSLADLPAVYTAPMQVVANYLNGTFLWDEVRAKGGAYGAGVSVSAYGIIGLTSYRDPHVSDTYDVFGRLPEWLENNLPGEEETDSLIVSTLSGYLLPKSKLDAGYAAMYRWICGRTAADRQANIKEILHTDRADFIAFAAALRTLNRRGAGVRAALGSEKPIRESGIFESIKEL